MEGGRRPLPAPNAPGNAAQERADELAKANEALWRSLTTLTTTTSLQTFLRTALQQAIYASGAISSTVFVLDAATNTLPLAEIVLQGEILDVQTDPRLEIWRAAPAFSFDFWTHILQKDQILWHDLDNPPFQIEAAVLDWYQQMGHEVLVWIPMFLQNQALGFLGLAFSKATQPTENKLEQCRILAQHAALALQTARLSEEAKQVAIAREREQAAQERAAELAKTNESLQRSLSSLTTIQDLSTFLKAVLKEVILTTGAASAAVFVHNVATNTLHITEMFLWGEATEVATDPRLDIWRTVPADISDLWRQMSQNNKIFWFDNDSPPPEEWTFANEWHRQMGHRMLATIPLKVEEQVLGFLGLAFADLCQPNEVKLEQANAMAQQIALAMQISRLSEEAQQVAIAREREQIAHERAEELAKTNSAMQRSLSSLAASEKLQSFLPTAVREAIEISGAVSAAVFIYNSTTHSFSLAEMHLWGEVVDINTDPRATFWQTIPSRTHAAWKKAAETGKVHWYQNTEPPPDWDYETQWHYQLGHQGLGAIPMLVDGQVVGTLGLAFAEPERPEGRLERCQFLVNQIALAFYLSRLSEEVKQVAITREREKAAQERAEELATVNAALTQRDRLLSVIAQITQELLENPDVEQAIAQAIQIMGQAVSASSVNLLQQKQDADTGRLYHHMIIEWTAPQITQQTNQLATSIVNNDDIPSLVSRLHDGETMSLDLEDYPEFLRPHLARLGLKTSCVAPIFVEDCYFGCLCFDDYIDRRLWSAQEIEVLSAGAGVIGTALLRQRLVDRAIQTQAERERAAELARSNEALTKRDRLLSVVAQITQELLENLNTEEAIFQAMEKLGYAAGASRINVLQERLEAETGRLRHYVNLEWTIPNVPRQIDDPDTQVVNNDDFTEIFANLHAGRSVCLYLEEYPAPVQPYLARIAIQVSGIAPIFMGNEYFGCLCLDNCIDRRLWSDQEMEVLATGARAIGAALLRQKLADQLMQARAEEERADELAKANAAMNRILTLSTRETGIDSLLSSVLAAIAEQFDTPLVEWWGELDATTVSKWLTYLNGRLLTAEEVQGHHGVPYFKLPSALGTIDDLLAVPYLCDDIETLPYDEPVMEKIRTWYVAKGLTKFFAVRVKVDGHGVGYLCIMIRGDRTITETQVQFASGMAQHLALAIMISQRAEAAQQAIIAHEREQAAQERVAELASINEALTQRDRLLSIVAQITKDLLENPDVEQAIEQALQQLGQATYAQRVNLLEQRQDIHTGQMQHVVTAEWAAPNTPRMIDNPVSRIVNDDDYAAAFAELHAGRPVCIYLEDYPEPARTLQAQLGVKSTGVAPIFIEGEYFGCLGFDNCVESRLWSDYEKDVLTTGAGAIGAAIRRQQLIHQLVEERTQAEQERITQLEQTNQSLQRMIAYLNENPSLQAFLQAILQESLTVSGAVTSAIFAYDAASHTLQQIACVLHGEIVDIATDPRLEVWRAPVPADITPAWKMLCHPAGTLWIDNGNPPLEHWPISIPWHQQFGHQTIAALVLFDGEHYRGFLGLCFATAVPLEETKLAQCRALAQQVSLALRLESLSQQATQSALLAERNRMAGEIHDTLAQSFTGINFQINLAKRIAEQHPEEARQIYDRIAQLAQNGLAEARRSVWSLYSSSEIYETLEQDLHGCIKAIIGTSSTIQVKINTSGIPYALPETLGRNLLRIGQEALTNIFKHAQASAIEIEILYQAHQICLNVKDNGCGFVPQEKRTGFGLVGMTERAERMNGQLTITTTPGQGTSIFIQVPLSNRP